MSLSDISSGMSFANNYNDMINEANVQAISDATQLTAIAQEGADNNALQKQQSDNVGDYAADGEDAFGLLMSGRTLNNEMLKGIHEKGVKGYFSTEGKKLANNFVKKKTGMTLDEVGEQANKAKDAIKTGAKQVKAITTKPLETLTQEAPTPEVAQTTSQWQPRRDSPHAGPPARRAASPPPRRRATRRWPEARACAAPRSAACRWLCALQRLAVFLLRAAHPLALGPGRHRSPGHRAAARATERGPGAARP